MVRRAWLAALLCAAAVGCDGMLGIDDYTFDRIDAATSTGSAHGGGGGAAAAGDGAGGGDAPVSGSSRAASGSGGSGGVSCDADMDGSMAIVCGGDDCDDANPDVHPGQMRFFTQPYEGGSYDYDCDGTEELEYSAIVCGSVPILDCDQSKVGLATALDCGQTGADGHCAVNVTSCQFTQTGQKTQGCH